MSNLASMRRATDEAEASATDILVVDDNPRNLLAIDVALGDFAGQLVKAKSGEDALRALLRQDFALILLDVQMPGLDGFETARLIRSRDRCKHVPIIFVTAFDQKREEVLRGYELGAVDFLFKPIMPEILKAKVAAFVELRKHLAEIARQEKLLREHERREQEERLVEARRAWDAEMLRRSAVESEARAEQLALIVAEREKAQAELTRANQELELADRRKNEFLATLAHELRTPLSPIAIGINLLRELVPDRDEVARVLSAMHRQSTHLVRLVDDLLEVSRISRGKIELQRADLALADAVDQAVQMCKPMFEDRSQGFHVEACSDLLYVAGDRVRLTQVVANLLTNAARYTQIGGKIALLCSREGNEAVLRVSDNGRGMTPELIGRVFEIFVQGEGGEESSGLGIGLSLVKQLVEMHGGSVVAESEGAGKGSTFTVRLPLLADDIARERKLEDTGLRLRSAASSARQLQVLLVEDNEDIRELTATMLERAGHVVAAAEDGASALELANQQPFDIALVDIGLPDIGGVEVARRLRELLGTRTRLVAVTGYGHAKVMDEAAAAGFDAYLIKPVVQKELDVQLAIAADPEGAQNDAGRLAR